MNADFMKNIPREALPNAEELNSNDSVPWYLRYAARILATIGGVLSIVLGILSICGALITLSTREIAAAALEILGGILVTLLEASFFCPFLSFAQEPEKLLRKSKSPFVKAILFIVIGLLPIMISPGMTAIFGSGVVLVAGVFYAVIGFGRKAPREHMTAAALGQSPSSMEQARPPVY